MDQLPQGAEAVDQPRRRPLHQLQQALNALSEVVQPFYPQSPGHALLRSEEIDQYRLAVAVDILEEQRRASGLDAAVSDLGYLQLAVDRRLHPA